MKYLSSKTQFHIACNISITILFFVLKEMDLIEVLWKQDADLGFKNPLPSSKSSKDVKEAKTENEDIEKLNTLLKLKEDKVKT